MQSITYHIMYECATFIGEHSIRSGQILRLECFYSGTDTFFGQVDPVQNVSGLTFDTIKLQREAYTRYGALQQEEFSDKFSKFDHYYGQVKLENAGTGIFFFCIGIFYQNLRSPDEKLRLIIQGGKHIFDIDERFWNEKYTFYT